MAMIDYYHQSRKHPNTLTPAPRPTPNATFEALPQFEPPDIEFILYVYKTQQCHHSSNCFLLNCKFYHDQTDQRRIPSFHPSTGFNYSWKVEEGGCCNRWEEVYHPMVYKTEMCGKRPECGGKVCPYAHGTKQLRHPEVIYCVTTRLPAQIGRMTKSEDCSMGCQVPTYRAILSQRDALRDQYDQIQLRIKGTVNRLKCSICHLALRTGVTTCCGALLCPTCTQGNEQTCKSCGAPGKEVIKLVSNPTS